jgi:predicted Rossmann-fold nucleotide-binding protein
VLVTESYWSGLLEWARERMLGEGKIGPRDLDLLRLSDDPAEVVAIVTSSARRQGLA